MKANEPRSNAGANAGILVYAIVLTLAGVGLLIATPFKGWSLAGYLGGGIMTLAGGSMLVTRLRGGLKYVSFPCPRCKHEQTFAEEALAAGRVAPCKKCFEYMERDGAGVQAVPEDRVAAEPSFEAPFPENGLSWEPACALCGARSAEREACTGNSRKGDKIITRTIEVPVCASHRGQKAVHIGSGLYFDGNDNFSLRFRSYAERQRFLRNNVMPMKVTERAVTFGHA